MVAISSDAINSFVHIEGKKISLADDLQLVARRVDGLRWTCNAERVTCNAERRGPGKGR